MKAVGISALNEATEAEPVEKDPAKAKVVNGIIADADVGFPRVHHARDLSGRRAVAQEIPSDDVLGELRPAVRTG